MVSVATIVRSNLENLIVIDLDARTVTVMATAIMLIISYKNHHNGMILILMDTVMNSMDIKGMHVQTNTAIRLTIAMVVLMMMVMAGLMLAMISSAIQLNIPM